MATILLVEDDLPLLELYESALATSHQVLAVDSVQSALALLEKGEVVDLIVLDLNLPDAPGTVLIEEMASFPEYAHLPVVVMTGFKHLGAQQMAENVVEVLTKPVTISSLQRIVRAALHESSER
ncbi:MAG: response regulator [Anaerolineae bacterium]|nr:response regulator [Anaerolineae bacterium]